MVIGVKQKIFISLISISLFASISFGFFIYISQKNTFYESLEKQLRAAINATILYLGEDFVDKYTQENPIDRDLHFSFVEKLSKFAQETNLEYIYVMIKDKDIVRTSLSSATKEELEKGEYDEFLVEYEASQLVQNGFFKNNEFFENTIDKYGHFYSLIKAFESPEKKLYLIGADIDIAEVHSSLNNILIKTILITLLIQVLAIVFAYLISSSIGKKIKSTQTGILDFFDFLSRKKSSVSHLEVKELDEFGIMAKTINENIDIIQKGVIADNQTVNEFVNISNQIQVGNLNGKIELNPSNPQLLELKNVFNSMVLMLNSNVKLILEVLEKYSLYDFTKKIENKDLQGELGKLVLDVNNLGSEITNLLVENMKNGVILQNSSTQLLNNVNILNSASNKAAVALEETAAAIEEITGNIRQSNQNISSMTSLANNLNKSSKDGEQLAHKTTNAMQNINNQVEMINEAITVIDNIAFQTNILSLNAAVEAATAGEAGKGFAVVAQEVRNLATRSAEAAKEIKNLVEKAKEITSNGRDIANNMIDGYSKLNSDINLTIDLISSVQGASKEQLLGIEQINNAINSLDKQTQDNANVASLTKEIAQSTDKIAKIIVEDTNNKEFIGKNSIKKTS
ncbi:MCP-domain signal transduction protein [Aliarcobacter faecis]|uniref:methyl-accepting chemotaxis protein n=1 Tax=Aliarcobacter faecis TaxID=1564138 RepID=UPI00047ACA6C|nr:methyl-accepting chemotaxis protein [Aliarcobacter faecis]QKF73599.1 MCP-domain signal transduction protein [Aliarcobacter faecis]